MVDSIPDAPRISKATQVEGPELDHPSSVPLVTGPIYGHVPPLLEGIPVLWSPSTGFARETPPVQKSFGGGDVVFDTS